ncbi:serine/threonine-protein phosphatase [Streptomyces sp. OF8]|uniref:Serine/threonine-protein phosphatase n=1 Tax=Streptomyces alkaliterrae TaxID=2213162 RepID=A0A5P0YTU9_9ACTN|nr:PP2C family protein-serine/threonine phosphatase [Streptomyces alkaliterrae]MBB1261668.1 serine/threonine-protein phosphatase [Streptomyces alkaliterrae]MQS03743.1 SpoIIE family protein phosphatase [Streptomyces alkaliterrae]
MTTHHLPKVAGINPPLSPPDETVRPHGDPARGGRGQGPGDDRADGEDGDGTGRDGGGAGRGRRRGDGSAGGPWGPVDRLAAVQDHLAGWIHELTALHDLTERLARTRTLDDALHETLRGGASLVGAQRGLIVLEPADGLGPEQTVGLGLGRSEIGQIETVTDGSAFYGRLLDSRLLDGLPTTADGRHEAHPAPDARSDAPAAPAAPEAHDRAHAPAAHDSTTAEATTADPATDPAALADEITHPDIAGEDDLDPLHREVAARLGYAASYAVPLVATSPAPEPEPESDAGARQQGQPDDGADRPEAGGATARRRAAGIRLGAAVWLYDEPAEPSARRRHLLGLYLRCAAEHLARRLTLARAERANAAVHEELLPSRLPRVPGLTLAVRHRTGPRGGGDWYDVLPLPDAAVGLSVGGVTGSGPSAVAAMGRLRASLRAYAVMEGEDPVAVLSDLELLMRLTEPARSATALFGYAEPAARRIVVAGAGHCPPLVVGPRRCEFAETTLSAPLGMLACWEAPSVELMLDAGETLLLYTDGVLHRSVDAGPGEAMTDQAMARLHAVVRAAAPEVRAEPEALVDHVLAELLGPRQWADDEEDVVLLAARF